MSIKCTYHTCFLVFDNETDMKKHKKKDPSHDYCHKCDVDLEDDLEYFIHQIENPQHICCPLCGVEFKSNSGRDRHVELSHHSDQNLPCAGCGEIFTRASGLMSHIEKGKCGVIRPKDFQRQKAEKAVVKEAVAEMLDPTGGSYIVNENQNHSTNDSEVASGPSLLLNDPSQHIPKDWGGNPIPPVLPDTIRPFDNSQYPVLNPARQNLNTFTGNHSSTTAGQGDLLDLDEPEQRLKGFHIGSTHTTPTMSINQRTIVSPKKENRAPTMFGQLTENSLNNFNNGPSPAAASLRSQSASGDFRSQISNLSGFNANSFYDQIRDKFVCPGQKCKKEYATAEEFKAHLLSGVHRSSYVTCPSCLKQFKTTTALIAHCESASRRCNIRTSTNYNQVLREITGGIIGSENFLEDGSIRYTAPSISEW